MKREQDEQLSTSICLKTVKMTFSSCEGKWEVRGGRATVPLQAAAHASSGWGDEEGPRDVQRYASGGIKRIAVTWRGKISAIQ